MNIVIVGAGYAGVICALRSSRKARGKVAITLVSETDRFVERIRLHEQGAGGGRRCRELAPFLRGSGVTLKIGRAEHLDLERKVVLVGDEPIPYDRLVLALGSHTSVELVPGIREHALTIDRADRIAERVGELADGRVVVVGGGLTGIEAAAELAEAHPSLRVALLTREPLMAGWSRAAREHVLAVMERLRVEVREGVDVRRVAEGRVETGEGAEPFDICVWTAGFGFSDLPKRAGLSVDHVGRVIVDPMLRSISHPDVYVPGDLGAYVDPYGQPLDMGCKTAMPMGAHVADNLARAARGRDERAFDAAVPLYCVSLGRHDGLIQFMKNGEPTGAILTNGLAAMVKETICRFTVWSLSLEKRGVGYRWAHRGRARARAAGLLRA